MPLAYPDGTLGSSNRLPHGRSVSHKEGGKPQQLLQNLGMWMHQYCPFGQFFGTPFLTKEPKLLLNDDKAGKPEGIHLMIGRRRWRTAHDASSAR